MPAAFATTYATTGSLTTCHSSYLQDEQLLSSVIAYLSSVPAAACHYLRLAPPQTAAPATKVGGAAAAPRLLTASHKHSNRKQVLGTASDVLLCPVNLNVIRLFMAQCK
jgi:hypothetical protein